MSRFVATTPTAAATSEHVFALLALLGFQFAPRIPDLKHRRLYSFAKPSAYPTLEPLIAGGINVGLIRAHWPEILRVAASIRTGTVTASLIMRQLAAYPRQNGVAAALRELGRLERTLFTLDWIEDPELRRDTGRELNKMGYPGRPCWTCLHSSLTLGRGARAAHQPGGVHALRGSRRVDAADGGLRSRRYGQGHA